MWVEMCQDCDQWGELIFSDVEASGCATPVFVSSVVEEVASRSNYFYE